MVDKHAIAPLHRQDTTPGQPREDQAEQPAFSRFTRRAFLEGVGMAGITTSAVPFLHPAHAEEVQTPAAATTTVGIPGAVPMVLKVNGQEHRLQLEPRVTLLDALREYLHLFGTKKGCDHGQCGACTVHVNGRRVNACLTFAIMHQGDEITTIEGLAQRGELHPVQAAFLEHDGFQCGYCTPGQIMSAVALLKEPCGQDDDAVRECMSGNICRCGAYPNIVAAVQAARRRA
jgi:xanthine dehydrogenase YagT iron-sulfur-binding subunit